MLSDDTYLQRCSSLGRPAHHFAAQVLDCKQPAKHTAAGFSASVWLHRDCKHACDLALHHTAHKALLNCCPWLCAACMQQQQGAIPTCDAHPNDVSLHCNTSQRCRAWVHLIGFLQTALLQTAAVLMIEPEDRAEVQPTKPACRS